MTIEIDPGQKGQEVQEGSTVPLANTQPNVNPDQILASLDGDTQSFLQLLLQGGAQGLYGHSEQLSAGLRRFDPTVRDIARINSALAKRRQNLRRVITNFGKLSTALGHRDTQLARFVRSSNTVLGSFAKEQNAIRATLQEFPPTLEQTQSTLTSANRFAQILGPASRKLIPSAQALAPALRQVRPLFRETTIPIKTQIRPFARAGRRSRSSTSTRPRSRLPSTTTSLTKGFNESEPPVQRPRVQPARSLRRGLSVLALLAEPQHELRLLHTGRGRAAPPRPRPALLRHRRDRLGDLPQRSLPQDIAGALASAAPGRRSPPTEAVASGDTPADSHPHPRRARLRAVVLRPGAVPVDRVRRPAAAEAGGLSLHVPVHGGDAPARGRVRRPDLGVSRSAR